MEDRPAELTRLLRSANAGEPGAHDRLAAEVYADLRGMAERMMARERGQTLQPTALVSEAWLRLADGGFESRRHFFGAAAQAMRRLLVEAARRRRADKRGGAKERVTFQDLAVECVDEQVDLLALDEALADLERFDPRLAENVRLRFFAGLTIPQIAELLGVSPATVKRDWTYARAWLFERIEGRAAEPAEEADDRTADGS